MTIAKKKGGKPYFGTFFLTSGGVTGVDGCSGDGGVFGDCVVGGEPFMGEGVEVLVGLVQRGGDGGEDVELVH